jgi:acylphosphatase
VLINASGPADAIQQLVDWAKDGPPAARVDTINVQDLREGDTI